MVLIHFIFHPTAAGIVILIKLSSVVLNLFMVSYLNVSSGFCCFSDLMFMSISSFVLYEFFFSFSSLDGSTMIALNCLCSSVLGIIKNLSIFLPHPLARFSTNHVYQLSTAFCINSVISVCSSGVG